VRVEAHVVVPIGQAGKLPVLPQCRRPVLADVEQVVVALEADLAAAGYRNGVAVLDPQDVVAQAYALRTAVDSDCIALWLIDRIVD